MRSFTVVRGQEPTTVCDTAPDGSREDRVVGVEPDSKTYHGFNRDFNPLTLQHVAVVLVDGEVDVWAVDNPSKVSELVEYLSEENGSVVFCGLYSRK